MGLNKKDLDQLVDHIGNRATEGADSDSLDEKQEILEEIASLCDSDSTLIFNANGTVEIDGSDDSDDSDGSDGND
jgi:hypothetical protein